MDTTIPVTLEDIIHHTKAAKRCVCLRVVCVRANDRTTALTFGVCAWLLVPFSGASRPLIVADMPFGTCEGDPYEALKNAQRLLKVRAYGALYCTVPRVIGDQNTWSLTWKTLCRSSCWCCGCFIGGRSRLRQDRRRPRTRQDKYVRLFNLCTHHSDHLVHSLALVVYCSQDDCGGRHRCDGARRAPSTAH